MACTAVSFKMSLHVVLVALAVVTISAVPQKEQNPFVQANGSSISERIVGGEIATPHAYPYQVALYCNSIGLTTFCGGSLISPNYVLTSASCAEGSLSMDVVLGAHDIEASEITQSRQTSGEFIIHPDWDKSRLINDIALVRLSQAVLENDYIKYIKLATGSDSFAGRLGVATGWGRMTNDQQNVTPLLRYASTDILSNDVCRNIDPYSSVIQSTHLCLSGVSSSKNVGACYGDFGGPLVVGGVQVGIASFGYKDCQAGKPSVFTRLSEFSSWIRANSDVELNEATPTSWLWGFGRRGYLYK